MKRAWVLAVLACLFLTACSERLVRVRPYQRESFAREKMLFDPMEHRSAYHQHVFSIREGSQGGWSSFQGGCGCR